MDAATDSSPSPRHRAQLRRWRDSGECSSDGNELSPAVSSPLARASLSRQSTGNLEVEEEPNAAVPPTPPTPAPMQVPPESPLARAVLSRQSSRSLSRQSTAGSLELESPLARAVLSRQSTGNLEVEQEPSTAAASEAAPAGAPQADAAQAGAAPAAPAEARIADAAAEAERRRRLEEEELAFAAYVAAEEAAIAAEEARLVALEAEEARINAESAAARAAAQYQYMRAAPPSPPPFAACSVCSMRRVNSHGDMHGSSSSSHHAPRLTAAYSWSNEHEGCYSTASRRRASGYADGYADGRSRVATSHRGDLDDRRAVLGLPTGASGLPGAPPEVLHRASKMIAGQLVADAAKAAVAGAAQQRCAPGRTASRLAKLVALLCGLGLLLVLSMQGQWAGGWPAILHVPGSADDGGMRPLRGLVERPSSNGASSQAGHDDG